VQRQRGRTAVLEESERSPVDQTTAKDGETFAPGMPAIPTFTFLSGEALGKELPMLQSRLTLGRGGESDVLIMDPAVSRRHVLLTRKNVSRRDGKRVLKVVLQDLGSKNGTLVNYRSVKRVVLKPGDKIILGRAILKFEYRDVADQSFYEEIYRLATVDNLTSLLNRSAITRFLNDEVTKRLRYPGSLSILMIDLDEFKQLNDMHGHLAGDGALRLIGDVLRRNLRAQDKGGRFGGDEFLVVLPETGIDGAVAVAERIRADLETAVCGDQGLPRPVTASIGVATCADNACGSRCLLEKADAAVYRAKTGGKNRVEMYQETCESREEQ